MEFNKKLVERLTKLVDESGMAQARISERAGKRPGWLADMIQGWKAAEAAGKRGPAPTAESLWYLARGLNITLGELLGPELRDGPPRQPTTLDLEREDAKPTTLPEPAPKKRGRP